MSLKGKIRICLLVYFCAAGLTAAFNGQRKSSGDVSIHPHNGQHEETKDAHIVPATHQETTQKRNTRIRRAHERNRRDTEGRKEAQDAILEIFSQRPTQSVRPHRPPPRIQRPPLRTLIRRPPQQFPARAEPIPQGSPLSRQESTGLNLNPAAPGRQPSVTPPPALHSGGNVNSQAGQAGPPGQAGQQIRPQQPLRTTTLSPLRTTTRRSTQQFPARPLPIPQRPPVSRPYPQRPPLRPVVGEPPQELDGHGLEPSQGDNCVWAIVRCCNQVPKPVSVPRCFELLGCPGAYFDNPCESDTARSIARLAKEIQQNGQGLLYS